MFALILAVIDVNLDFAALAVRFQLQPQWQPAPLLHSPSTPVVAAIIALIALQL